MEILCVGPYILLLTWAIESAAIKLRRGKMLYFCFVTETLYRKIVLVTDINEMCIYVCTYLLYDERLF